MAPVVIYSTSWCPYCVAAKRFLASKNVPFEERDITGDDKEREALHVRTGRTSVPQIFVGDHHVGGYDEMRALDRAGGFMPLLQAGG